MRDEALETGRKLLKVSLWQKESMWKNVMLTVLQFKGTSFSGGKLSVLPFEELNRLLLKTLIEQKIEHLKL